MRLKGQNLGVPNIEVLVIPRPSSFVDGKEVTNDIVFKFQPVSFDDAFDKLCPRPLPPMVLKPGGERIHNVEDEDYKKAIVAYAEKRVHWLVLNSIKATEGLEWDTVNMADSATWKNYVAELEAQKFIQPEINLIIGAAYKANSLDDERLEEAKKNFLRMQPAASVKQ